MTTSFLWRWTTALLALSVLAGCASYDLGQGLQDVERRTGDFAQQPLQLATRAQEREQRDRMAADILAKPLDQQAAVQIGRAHV